MENMVSVEDNKNIFNLEPTHIQDVITSINKIKDKALFAIYTLQPPRRVEDFQFMKLTTEQYPTKQTNLNLNYCILVNGTPKQFIYNNYKTYSTFGQQIIDINNDLATILEEYIQYNKIKIGEYLFGLPRDRRESNTNFSKHITTLFSNVFGQSAISCRWIRISFATYLSTLQLSLKQREKYSFMMAHSVQTNLGYVKNVISVESFINESD